MIWVYQLIVWYRLTYFYEITNTLFNFCKYVLTKNYKASKTTLKSSKTTLSASKSSENKFFTTITEKQILVH